MHWPRGSFGLLGEPKVQAGLKPTPALKDAPGPVSGGGGSTGGSACLLVKSWMIVGTAAMEWQLDMRKSLSAYRPWHGLERENGFHAHGKSMNMLGGRIAPYSFPEVLE